MLLYTSTRQQIDIGGNCSECGIFAYVEGRERVTSQAIRPNNVHPKKSLSQSGDGSTLDESLFLSETPMNEVL